MSLSNLLMKRKANTPQVVGAICLFCLLVSTMSVTGQVSPKKSKGNVEAKKEKSKWPAYTKKVFLADLEKVRQDGSVKTTDAILQHGDQNLPWLLEHLSDFRKMETGVLEIRNPPSVTFEEFATYAAPHTISVTVRIFLMNMTGHTDLTFGSSDELESPRDQQAAIKDWRLWYKKNKAHLRWDQKRSGWYIVKTKAKRPHKQKNHKSRK